MMGWSPLPNMRSISESLAESAMSGSLVTKKMSGARISGDVRTPVTTKQLDISSGRRFRLLCDRDKLIGPGSCSSQLAGNTAVLLARVIIKNWSQQFLHLTKETLGSTVPVVMSSIVLIETDP